MSKRNKPKHPKPPFYYKAAKKKNLYVVVDKGLWKFYSLLTGRYLGVWVDHVLLGQGKRLPCANYKEAISKAANILNYEEMRQEEMRKQQRAMEIRNDFEWQLEDDHT